MNKPVLFFWISILLVPMFVCGQSITSGLVAHWSFDNDSAQLVRDQSANKFNGISNGIEYAIGIKGKASVFNLNSDAVFFPGQNQNPPEKISNLNTGTISVWFNFQNNGGNILPVFYFGEKSETAPHNSLIIEIGHGPGEGDPTNRRLYFTIVNQKFCFDSRINLNPDTWYHFVAIVNPTGNTGFLNGEELVGRRYNLGSDFTYHDFFVDVPAKEVLSLGYGRFGQDDRFFHFKGMIDEVRIYDRPLNSLEVQMLWKEGFVATGIYNADRKTGNKRLKIYPNPAQEYLIAETGSKTRFIDFFLPDGRKIHTVANPDSNCMISTKHWKPGFYYARTDTGDFAEILIK